MEFAPEANITFETVAVTPEQIAEWDLPTRPTKKRDSRSKRFKGGSVDVDAIPPDRLRKLCEKCIERHVIPELWERSRRIAEAERD